MVLRIENKNGVAYADEKDLSILEEYFKERMATNEPLKTIKELLEKQGFKPYEDHCINRVEAQHFIKDTELIQILHVESADEEELEEIKQEHCNDCDESIKEKEKKRQLTDLSYLADRTQAMQE